MGMTLKLLHGAPFVKHSIYALRNPITDSTSFLIGETNSFEKIIIIVDV